MLRTTTLYAALLGFLLFILSIQVIRVRRRDKISLGDGNDSNLQRFIRAQGNFTEYVPLCLLLLLLNEVRGTSPFFLHTIGLTLLVGRVSHAFAFSSPYPRFTFRVVGMMLTFSSLLLGAGGTLLSLLR